MFTVALLSGLVLAQTSPTAPAGAPKVAPVAPKELRRSMPIGLEETYTYSANILSERRDPAAYLDTFFPSSQKLSYNYKINVKSKKTDDISVMDYIRSNFQVLIEEAGTGEPTSYPTGPAWNLELVVSPTNAVLDVKDKSPKKPEKKTDKKPEGDETESLKRMQDEGEEPIVVRPTGQDYVKLILGQSFDDLQRTAIMYGSFDSSMDFAPGLPDDAVAPGDTWDATMTYQPQKARGTKAATVQRLDMQYTYVGLVKVNNKMFEQITAKVKMDSDLKDYVDSNFGIPKGQSPFKSVRMKFEMEATFNLDPKTMRTVYATLNSKGSMVTDADITGSRQISEDRFTAEAKLMNKTSKIVPPKAGKPAGKPVTKPKTKSKP